MSSFTRRQVYEFISKQNNDPIIERKICPQTGEEFAVFQGDIDLLDRISPIIQGIKHPLPTPKLSPSSRMRNRMMRRNERGLYKTTSAISGKPIITIYNESLGYRSVTALEHMSDIYEEQLVQRLYDPTKSFFAQYGELLQKSLKVGTITINNENGDYNTYSSDSKNIYLCADCMWCEDTYYSTTTKYTRDCVDVRQVHNSDTVVGCISSDHLTKCMYVWYSQNCYDCGFLYTSRNCTNCRFSSMLTDKTDYLFNKPATKDQIQTVRNQLKTWSGFKSLYEQFIQMLQEEYPRPGTWQINCEHSFGSNIYDCNDSFYCFDSHDLQGCRYCHVGEFNQDCMDCTIFNPQSTLNYEQICGGGSTHHCISCSTSRDTKHAYYCELSMYCHHLLGCSMLKNKEYCILNTSYTSSQREEYAVQIIQELQNSGQRGEFLPSRLCPFPYNDSVAMDYFPIHTVISSSGEHSIVNPDGIGTVTLQSDEFISPAILDFGGEEKLSIKRRTRNYEINIPSDREVVSAHDLPEDIILVDESILKKVILCIQTGRPYTILPKELEIYKKLGLALPRVHYHVRHLERIKTRPKKSYTLRQCDQTGEQILSVYPDGAKFPVRSQQAFEQAMYQ